MNLDTTYIILEKVKIGFVISFFVAFCLVEYLWFAANRQPSNFNYADYQAAQARASQRAEILAEVHRQDVEHTASSLRGY